MRKDYLLDLEKIEKERRRKIWIYGLVSMAIIGVILTMMYFEKQDQIISNTSLDDVKETDFELLQENERLKETCKTLIQTQKELEVLTNKQAEIIKKLEAKLNENMPNNGSDISILADLPVVAKPDIDFDGIEKTYTERVKKLANNKYKIQIKDPVILQKLESKVGGWKIDLSQLDTKKMHFEPSESKFGVTVYYSKAQDLKAASTLREQLYTKADVKAEIKRVKSTGDGNPLVVY